MILANYPTGGLHPETAALRNAMAYSGIQAPHTDAPYTEALLFGVGGGLGIGTIVWEFQKHNMALLTLGFRNRWQDSVGFYQTLADRLSLTLDISETGSLRQAAHHLNDALEADRGAVAWVNSEALPHLFLPPTLSGYFGHVVGVYGLANDTVWLDDRSPQPVTLPESSFATARKRIVSYKNRLLTVCDAVEADLPAAIWAGIDDCVTNLSGDSQSFALPALDKWANLLTNTRNKKGWPQVFAGGLRLYGVLKSLYAATRPLHMSGGNLRGLYADFLDEAAGIIGRTDLHPIANRYRALDADWQALGDAALPDSEPTFVAIKKLLNQKHAVFSAKGSAGMDEMTALTEHEHELESGLNAQFPLNEVARTALFVNLQMRLNALADAERAALAALQAAAADR